jgi:hypothetical protein
MKTYFVRSTHIISEDDFEQGEGAQVNWYKESRTIEANDPGDAIHKYFSNVLYYKFDMAFSVVDGDTLFYDVMVDDDNAEASDAELLKWKSNQMKLYVNRIEVQVTENIPLDLSSLEGVVQ